MPCNGLRFIPSSTLPFSNARKLSYTSNVRWNDSSNQQLGPIWNIFGKLVTTTFIFTLDATGRHRISN